MGYLNSLIRILCTHLDIRLVQAQHQRGPAYDEDASGGHGGPGVQCASH